MNSVGQRAADLAAVLHSEREDRCQSCPSEPGVARDPNILLCRLTGGSSHIAVFEI